MTELEHRITDRTRVDRFGECSAPQTGGAAASQQEA